MSKRTLDAYLKPVRSSAPSATDASPSKKLKETLPSSEDTKPADTHPSYPFPINALQSHVSTALQTTTPARAPKQINNQPHLDLLYYEPFIPRPTADEYFKFLRRELPFYRVKYTIKRGPTETLIHTPRYTTVFGVDGTSYFSLPPNATNANAKEGGSKILLDSKTHQPIPQSKYKCTPRPIPACLDILRQHVETSLNDGTSYNFVLVNYYASGDDSISYHSDDERFLGSLPNIASLTLGARRDFLMKHKPVSGTTAAATSKDKPLKLPLGTGDMVIMRGETQSNWLHSIPKRKGGEAGSGRINITLRKAVVPGGTENYYRYNVGDGGLYRWDERGKEMVLT